MTRPNSALERWIERLLCSHEWTYWHSRVINFSNFAADYVDHFIDRDRRCLRCGKIEHERYFVPAISIGNTDADESGGIFRAMKDGRWPEQHWDERRVKTVAPSR